CSPCSNGFAHGAAAPLPFATASAVLRHRSTHADGHLSCPRRVVEHLVDVPIAPFGVRFRLPEIAGPEGERYNEGGCDKFLHGGVRQTVYQPVPKNMTK